MEKPLRGMTVAVTGAAVLPWLVAFGLPVRDPWTDLKWPALALLVLVAVSVMITEARFRLAGRRPWLFLAGCALAAAGLLVSLSLSPVPSAGSRIIGREITLLALAVVLAVRGVHSEEIRFLLTALAASAGLQAALVLLQGVGAFAPADAVGRARMIGTFGNPEHVAGWLSPVLAMGVVSLSSVGTRESAWRRRVVWAAVALIAIALVAGGGRGAVLGAAIGIWVGLRGTTAAAQVSDAPARLVPRFLLPLAAASLLVILALGVLVPSLDQSLPGRVVAMLDPHSVSVRHRLGLMTITSRMIADRPLAGYGPGLFPVAFDRQRAMLAADSGQAGPWVFNEIMSDQTAAEAHCDPLQWWAEYGLLAFCGLALALSSALAALSGGTRALDQRIVLAGLTAMAIGMFFSFPLHRPARALLFWLLTGMAAGLRTGDGVKKDARPSVQ